MKRLNKFAFSASLALTLSSSVSLQAQTMSLSDCINYALEHSLTIQQRQLACDNQAISLETTRMSRLPDLSASVSQGWSFGQTASAESNSYTSFNSSSTNFGLSASMPVFTGFRITNQIKADQFSLQAASANLEKAKKDIGVQVSSYYLNALYYKGMLSVQQRQVELDSVALQNARTLFAAGKKPESEVATAEAQLAMSRHSLTEAVGNEVMARLDLMQTLNMEGDVRDFKIKDIDTTQLSADVMPADQIFAAAVERYPSILAAKYQLESSKYSLKISQSAYLPSVHLSASYGTNYQHLYNSMYPEKSFADQFRDHASKYIGLSVNIPIFNRFSTRNSVKQARLNIESQNNTLTEAQQSLHKEIQQAYWNAIKAHDNYLSAQKASASTSMAYHYESERYAAGKGTSYDLQQASAKMQKSAQDELQAKYEFLMRLKILDFYNVQ